MSLFLALSLSLCAWKASWEFQITQSSWVSVALGALLWDSGKGVIWNSTGYLDRKFDFTFVKLYLLKIASKPWERYIKYGMNLLKCSNIEKFLVHVFQGETAFPSQC